MSNQSSYQECNNYEECKKVALDRLRENASVSEATRLTAQATWLAAQKGKKRVFEAYQQIAALAERYPPARVVRHALEQRARIPRLPKK